MIDRRFAAMTLALLGGCAMGPDYERPELPVPEIYVQPVDAGENFANLPWWELFGDQTLNDLIAVALEENQDIGIAAARIEEFRALLGVTRSNQFPTVDVGASAGRSRASQNTFLGNLIDGPVDSYQLGADVFFEVDLFGKLRRSTEAARALLLAEEENRRAVTISLVAAVAQSYMTLRDLDAQLEISRRTRDARQDTLDIINARFGEGVVARIDVNQAEIQLAIAAATVASAERAVVQTENQLSVLLGRNPGAIPRGRELTDQVLTPDIPAGLPSELLQRRPDVLATEAALAAQTARIGVAQASRWPSLSLTGALGLESQELADLSSSDSDFWNAGLGIVAPVYNAGRLRSQVEAEQARAEQALLSYRQVVLRAFAEVEDALVAVRTYRDEHAARQMQVAAASNAAILSRARYDGGVTSYLEVLDTERSLFNAELSQSQTLRLYLNSIIELYKALGGGWNPEGP